MRENRKYILILIAILIFTAVITINLFSKSVKENSKSIDNIIISDVGENITINTNKPIDINNTTAEISETAENDVDKQEEEGNESSNKNKAADQYSVEGVWGTLNGDIYQFNEDGTFQICEVKAGKITEGTYETDNKTSLSLTYVPEQIEQTKEIETKDKNKSADGEEIIQEEIEGYKEEVYIETDKKDESKPKTEKYTIKFDKEKNEYDQEFIYLTLTYGDNTIRVKQIQ